MNDHERLHGDTRVLIWIVFFALVFHGFLAARTISHHQDKQDAAIARIEAAVTTQTEGE